MKTVVILNVAEHGPTNRISVSVKYRELLTVPRKGDEIGVSSFAFIEKEKYAKLQEIVKEKGRLIVESVEYTFESEECQINIYVSFTEDIEKLENKRFRKKVKKAMKRIQKKATNKI